MAAHENEFIFFITETKLSKTSIGSTLVEEVLCAGGTPGLSGWEGSHREMISN